MMQAALKLTVHVCASFIFFLPFLLLANNMSLHVHVHVQHEPTQYMMCDIELIIHRSGVKRVHVHVH